jgi:hypothetical protein
MSCIFFLDFDVKYLFIFLVFINNDLSINDTYLEICAFFLLNKRYSFVQNEKSTLIQYKFKIAKNKRDESANKLTASKSIAYNNKMPTNNMLN